MADKNKKTKKEVYSAMLKEEVIQNNPDYKALVENEIALLEKKASNKKPTKTQEENEVYKAEILNTLTEEGATVTEIIKKSDMLKEKEVSVAKATALLTQLVKAEKVVNYSEGKKSLYKLA